MGVGDKGFVLSCSCWFHLVAHMAQFPPSGTHGSPAAPVAACRTSSGGTWRVPWVQHSHRQAPVGPIPARVLTANLGKGLCRVGGLHLSQIFTSVGPSAPPTERGLKSAASLGPPFNPGLGSTLLGNPCQPRQIGCQQLPARGVGAATDHCFPFSGWWLGDSVHVLLSCHRLCRLPGRQGMSPMP